MESCCERTTMRTEEEKRALRSRLNRLIGQLNGVKRMIEEDRYCGDVLVQLAAADRAVKGLSAAILERHMHSCLVEDIQKGNLGAVDEIVGLFKRFN